MNVPSDRLPMKKQYPWRRLWAPKETPLFLDEDGFVLDPAEHGPYFNQALSPLETLEQRCLVLLGEPGMGKSTELAAYVGSLNEPGSGRKAKVLFRNLNLYTTDQYLVNDLFQDPTYRDWLAGDHALYLCLDSFDEVQLRVETVVNLLVQNLGRAPVGRLFLRIACRGAEWPPSFGEQLASLWPEQENSPGSPRYAVYNLVALSRANIRIAVEHEGLDPDAFLAEIREARATGLAQRPLTLRFLLDSFRENDSLPRRRRVLFEKGCRRLCKEWNPSRAKGRSRLSPDQRLAVAARLAAISLLSNRPTFSLSAALEDPPTDALELRDLAGGKELLHGDSFLVDEAAVQETLQTALFGGRSGGTVEWAHQSYAEFLAARYLLGLDLPLAKLRSLLSHPTTGAIVPQLREVASAVAEEREDFLSAILASDDPTILLRTDLAEAEAHVKERLVGRLLEMLERQELTEVEFLGLQNLAHPDLAEQLRPYVQTGRDDPEYPLVSRFTFETARSCRVQELVPNLLQVAKNAEEESFRRRLAIRTVATVASPCNWVPELKPLLVLPPEQDPDDEVKGEALSVLWPTHLEAAELFSHLTVPQRDSFHGSYDRFLDRELAEGLRPQDLPVALHWISREAPYLDQRSAVRRAGPKIVLAAWAALEHHGVLEALSEVALEYNRQDLPLFSPKYEQQYATPVQDHPGRRRQLIQYLVETKSGQEFLLTQARHLDWPLRLVLVDDLEWLLYRAEICSVPEIQLRWLELVSCHVRQADPRLTERFLDIVTSDRQLRQHFSAYVDPVPDHARYIGSRLQDEQVENEADQQEEARIAEALAASEQGNSAVWEPIPFDVHFAEDDLEAGLVAEFNEPSLDPEMFGRLLLSLINRGSQKALYYATSLLESRLPSKSGPRQRALHAAGVLLQANPEHVWPLIAKRFDQGAKFVQDLVKLLASETYEVSRALKEDHIAELYIWMMKAFPPEDYPGWNPCGAPNEIGRFRDRLPSWLSSVGSWEAVTALEHIASRFPEHPWLKRDLTDARKLAQQNTWPPFEPRELLEMLHRGRRVVRSESELLEAVLEALKALEVRLHDKTPQAQFLWNNCAKLWRPKEETALSDYVAGFLKDKLRETIIGREVEISPSGGGKDGQKVDIKVDAIAKDQRTDEPQRLTVTIEVKGCWNRKLKTGMKTQLRDRYMAERSTTHGLYLVGWYRCDLWDEKDASKKRTPEWSLDRARAFFKDQATKLSENGKTLRAFVLDARLRGREDL